MIEPVSKDKCLPEILALFPDLIAHRHDIHQHPDCGFETQRTIGKIKEFLEKHNVSSKDMDDATCPGSLQAQRAILIKKSNRTLINF